MAEMKTQSTGQSVDSFLNGIADPQIRQDCFALVAMMSDLTHAAPSMWGRSIVGFGRTSYSYASGRAGEWFVIGFSPRKQNLTLYGISPFTDHPALLAKLGKHKIGKACLSIKRLDAIYSDVLRALLQASVDDAQRASNQQP